MAEADYEAYRQKIEHLDYDMRAFRRSPQDGKRPEGRLDPQVGIHSIEPAAPGR